MSFNSYLGTSTLTETSFNTNGSVKTVGGADNINQQILRALLIGKTETYFGRTIGSNLHKALFLPNDKITYAVIESFISEALTEQVPLIDTFKTSFTKQDVKRVLITVEYKVKQSQSEGSVTFPFDFNQ